MLHFSERLGVFERDNDLETLKALSCFSFSDQSASEFRFSSALIDRIGNPKGQPVQLLLSSRKYCCAGYLELFSKLAVISTSLMAKGPLFRLVVYILANVPLSMNNYHQWVWEKAEHDSGFKCQPGGL